MEHAEAAQETEESSANGAAEEEAVPVGGFEAAPEPEPEPAPPPGPVIVAEVDRLKAENLNLKLLNTVNKETILQHQLNDLQRERQDLNRQMAEMRHAMEVQYGINLTTHHIQPGSGLVVPRNEMDPQAILALQRMKAQLGQKG